MEAKKRCQIYSIPFKFRGAPQREKTAYLYYFTDELGREKYRDFDEKLCIFGRYRDEVDVLIIDKDRVSRELWNALLKGLGIKEIPALVVSDSTLNIENALEEGATKYEPPTEEITIYNQKDIESIYDVKEFLTQLVPK